MVTLLLGPYGHGKSTHIISQIKADFERKEHSFLIVPEQQTVVSERELASLLPPMAQLYTEATNFTRLANSVFRKTGGLKYRYVTKSEKNLIMYRAICEVRHLLQQYKIPKGREKSCIKLFLQAIGELKSYSVTIESLEKAKSNLENSVLKCRLEDLILIWSAYEEILNKNHADPYDDILLLEKKLGECEFFKDTNVYIDSFYGFTSSQMGVIRRILLGAKNVTIALDCPCDCDESTIQYKRIASTKKALLTMCKALSLDVEIVSFNKDFKHESSDIRHLAKSIWSFDAEPIASNGDVTLALAEDEFEECEFVASQIKKMVACGYKYSDFAIIARSTDSYRGIIDYCLEKYQIPHYLSSPSKLMTLPVIKMIFCALNAINGFKSEDIVGYAKCGYTDIDEESIYLLESYMYKWSIYGKKFKIDDYWGANPDGYVSGFTIEQEEALKKINGAREKILEKLQLLEKPFINNMPIKDCAIAIYNFLDEHKIKDKLNQEIAHTDEESAQELSQVWGAIVSSLETVVDVCTDVKCDIETFISLFSYVMMDAKIGTIPTGEDNVIIADASLVRAKNIKHVFVLGANVGTFPAIVDDNSFFSDTDKITLETEQINLSAKSDERGDDELLFFKNSISVASHTVTVTALKADINGNKKEPSMGFERIKALFKDLSIIDISLLPIEERIYTPALAKELFGASSKELKCAISSLVGINEEKESFKNESQEIDSCYARDLFGDKLYLSKSKIESFVKCRFNYYCTYVLKLKDSEKIRFTHNDIGNLVHAVFEHFLKLDRAKRKDYTNKEIYEIVTRLTDEYTMLVCGVHALSNKMKHLFDRLKSTICIFVKSLLEEMKSSKFTPEHFELSINGNGENAPLPLEFKIDDTTSVVMTGVADRVDIYRNDSTAYIKIFDYKTGDYSFKPANLVDGLDMQMLIYLLALCNMRESDFKERLLKSKDASPAGIVYLSLNINKTTKDKEIVLDSLDAKDNEERAVQEKVKRCGLELNNSELFSSDDKFNLNKKSLIELDDFDEYFELIKGTIATIGLNMLSGNAQACPLEGQSPCEYCKNSAVCRSRRVK